MRRTWPWSIDRSPVEIYLPHGRTFRRYRHVAAGPRMLRYREADAPAPRELTVYPDGTFRVAETAIATEATMALAGLLVVGAVLLLDALA